MSHVLAECIQVIRRAWAHRNLHRGHCEGCGMIFPDNHPKGEPACSTECAEQAWLDRQ